MQSKQQINYETSKSEYEQKKIEKLKELKSIGHNKVHHRKLIQEKDDEIADLKQQLRLSRDFFYFYFYFFTLKSINYYLIQNILYINISFIVSA